MAGNSIDVLCSDRNRKWCEFYRWTGRSGIQCYGFGCTFFTVVAIGTKSGIEPITCAVVGALLGFLLFNVYPASVFMGDTGSLALGGFVASAAYMLQMPIFIIIVGFIYLVEVLSVMIQVTYFKKAVKESLRWRRYIIILNCADGQRQELLQYFRLSQQFYA